MNEEIPKIDLPGEWIVDTNVNRKLLEKYSMYPVRLKCEIILLCRGGEIEATININRIVVKNHDLVIITTGSILQIQKIEGDPEVYILGFSQQYIDHHNQVHMPETLYILMGKAKITLKPAEADTLKNYFLFLQHLYLSMDEKTREKITYNIYLNIHTGISILYNQKGTGVLPVSGNEQLCHSFIQLLLQYYTQTRKVAWYAEKLKVTQVYLCTIVRIVTGKTCMELISYMVIMDAKSQLKLTDLSIQLVADSLNFSSVSFFSKYFKRYTGMSPLEYRNKG